MGFEIICEFADGKTGNLGSFAELPHAVDFALAASDALGLIKIPGDPRVIRILDGDTVEMAVRVSDYRSPIVDGS